MQSVKNNQYPKWKSTFSFKREKPPKNEILHLEVVSSSWIGLIYPEDCHILVYPLKYLRLLVLTNIMFLSLGSFGLRRYKPYGCREQQPYRKKLRPYRLRELSASRGGAAMENDHLDS